MHLWRISNYQDLLGIGGITKEGRWHNKGHPIVYLAEHPALAMLEVMVQLEIDAEDIPDSFKLLKVEVPNLSDVCLDLSNDLLTPDWQDNRSLTQQIGNQWLASSPSALLKVPSAVMPASYNYLLNPQHSSSRAIKIVEVITFPFDQRLTG